ncbi:hypothetical protein DSECCO2_422190 [anaerobic digester metagenome]
MIHLYALVNPMTANPDKLLPVRKNGDQIPIVFSYFFVNEKVFQLLQTLHAEGDKTISFASRSDADVAGQLVYVDHRVVPILFFVIVGQYFQIFKAKAVIHMYGSGAFRLDDQFFAGLRMQFLTLCAED